MMRKRKIFIFLIFLAGLAAGCGTKSAKEEKPSRQTAAIEEPQDAGPDADAEEPPPPPPEGRPVVTYREGQLEKMTEPQAQQKGLSVVDLSNFWVPYIFSERDGLDEERKPNQFRPIFRKLANNWPYDSRTVAAAKKIVERRRARWRAAEIAKLREEGVSEKEIEERFGTEEEKKSKDEDNSFEGGLGEARHYLEVYGIPPSLSVLRKRAIDEIGKPCFKDVDFDAIRRYDGFVSYRSNEVAKKNAKRGRPVAAKMRREMERLGVEDPRELASNRKSRISPGSLEVAIRWEAVAATQDLLVCEGFFPKGMEKRYWKGGLDWRTHMALLDFEHKNRIFGWGYLGKDTKVALGKDPKDRLFDGFLRVMTERIVDATGIIEDGSSQHRRGKPATYKDENGKTLEVRNLVAEFTASALRHMDLGTPDKVIAFLLDHDDDYFDSLFVALPLPKLPPYYGPEMDLHVVIDRGDVWYDYPFDGEGKRRAQPRRVMPKTTLLTKWNGQDIPLVTMNTTIGGWRTELASDGYEYYKYKNSDVGPRVWKDIVAGPVWLPPATTPVGDLVKKVPVGRHLIEVPNYDEFGPWYASAYGLVAAFHVRPFTRSNGDVVYHDNGIRSHGSVDYNSILRRFSHGCHRLYNHLAIRLFNFVLRHRPFSRIGQIPAGYSKEVVLKDEETLEEDRFTITLNTKGYKYELVNPIPVVVRSGRIRGKQRSAIPHYMPKPNEEYGADAQFLPEGYARKAVDDGGTPDTGFLANPFGASADSESETAPTKTDTESSR